ncbi:MAG: hypothetical protein ABI398_10025 [Devosia sp.]
MRKTQIDHLLEAAVAKALGVKRPPAQASRKMVHAHRPMKHAA